VRITEIERMTSEVLQLTRTPPIATFALNDPSRRNALGLAMFDALERAIAAVAADNEVHVVLLHGAGGAFCSGFDLGAAASDASLMPRFITRLSGLLRAIRRMPQIAIAAVNGPAIAGGCAVLSACDFVVVAPDATLGYPVHRIGVSPAVTIPTLFQAIGAGPARSLLMSGELIDGFSAHRIGLATHQASSTHSTLGEARAFAQHLAAKGVLALRSTKAALNQLDGSIENDAFEATAAASARNSRGLETQSLLKSWSSLGRR
jgi:enoyl-CoA hydratase/carnithine racemase